MGRRNENRARAVGEFSGLDLGDPRREARALAVMSRLATNPSDSLPEAMGTDAMLEGLYRHLSTPEVTLEELLRPHVQQTIGRLAKTEFAYAIHDTTGFVFGGQSRRKGLGHVDNSKDQGFLAHVTLTVEPGPERLPLGVLAVGTRSRVGTKTQAESARWEVGVSLAEDMVPKGKLIHVADRESDIYPLLSRAITESWRFVFRAAQDRTVWDSDNVVGLLFEEARGQAARLEFDVPLTARKANAQPKQRAAHPPRNSRIAGLSASSTRVRIKRPAKRKDGLTYVDINVVRVWEPQPPNGEPPVEWLLLTSEPVETEAQLRAVIEAYRARWVIEEFFCAIKTGCAYEEKQLESEKSLLNQIGRAHV